MGSRSEEMDRRTRRIFGYSLLAALTIHVVVFVATPEFKTKPLPDSRTAEMGGEGAAAPDAGLVDVFFGPPEIIRSDGRREREPRDRVLEARAVEFGSLSLPSDCGGRAVTDVVPTVGQLHLTLNGSGRVTGSAMVGSSGDVCRDAMMMEIMARVTYEWLPRDDVPAPVELIQPIRVVASIY